MLAKHAIAIFFNYLNYLQRMWISKTLSEIENLKKRNIFNTMFKACWGPLQYLFFIKEKCWILCLLHILLFVLVTHWWFVPFNYDVDLGISDNTRNRWTTEKKWENWTQYKNDVRNWGIQKFLTNYQFYIWQCSSQTLVVDFKISLFL